MSRHRTYRTVRAQAIHYLARPHLEVPRQPIRSAAAWTSADVRDESAWTYELTESDIAEIDRALDRSTAALDELRAEDVPLPGLAARFDRWRAEVVSGRGFVRIRGLPVGRWGEERAARFFWAFGQHLGRPGAQNGKGELLGHVRDLRLGRDGQVRQYMTSEAIGYHCDAADAVGLLCLRPAREGGLSRIASSVTIFNRILERRPDLVPLLFEPRYYDTRDDGGTDAFLARPAAFDGEQLRTFYHSEYIRTAPRHAGIPQLGNAMSELMDLYDELAGSPELYIEMDLRPGDIQLISNHSIVHARTGYTDYEDPEQRRHLLRLWLTLESPDSLTERLRRARETGRLLTGLAHRTLQRWWARRGSEAGADL